MQQICHALYSSKSEKLCSNFTVVVIIVGNVYRGTDEHFGISDKIDIINSTLGKALGGAAGKTELHVYHFYHLLSVQCQYNHIISFIVNLYTFTTSQTAYN